MVTKKIRSEYMKKFKDPKWDTYAKCYEDSLKYRLTRRLLEQSHRPWFWGGWESDSDSSDRSSPQSRKKMLPKTKEEMPPGSEPEALAPQKPENQPGEVTEPQVCAPEKGEQAETEKIPQRAVQATVNKDPMKRHELDLIGKEGLQAARLDGQGAVPPRRLRKSTRAKSQPRGVTEPDKENRHPFALYGSGEKQAEMAAKRTHNVGPCTSTSEIHASALRAKTRREVEKQLKAQGRRRARSADVEERHHTKLLPDYDPWMTEYMRCFSARSR
uniref:Centriole, cilia and spindle-associated protein b n=1 Tax=Paramormyrops kingsleyae TaxID=1676925 RepID=A0A3B3RSD2_9TELE|nr:centriole, cilia and spindle-associated protein [Paramormyrops kingsleyae]XP_023689531.1 centriole, cilia and spindle-associated protein [Paramormyrops kingsleyae]XP_023689532.1 centriole, cilia and spindle-associated protein [Paramormyrops kingsleyae]XP_023689534.1 centriole, cilia and spindle-associated protein [Paramormyrops kingsleyae]XP_023689535.1 centriole, cilia and spindle-associated protein [Paramormyrops kingsleyae]